jgi:hypothetical protein
VASVRLTELPQAAPPQAALVPMTRGAMMAFSILCELQTGQPTSFRLTWVS